METDNKILIEEHRIYKETVDRLNSIANRGNYAAPINEKLDFVKARLFDCAAQISNLPDNINYGFLTKGATIHKYQ